MGNEHHIEESKYKSKACKHYAGTNTFEDFEHENEPIGGDIYTRMGTRNLEQYGTMPEIRLPEAPETVSYGLNPYV